MRNNLSNMAKNPVDKEGGIGILNSCVIFLCKCDRM